MLIRSVRATFGHPRLTYISAIYRLFPGLSFTGVRIILVIVCVLNTIQYKILPDKR